MKQYTADDVIAGILSYIPDREFSNDPSRLHGCMARLRSQERYKDLLGDFHFVQYARYLYSPLLARALNRLQEARLLSSINPDYDRYRMLDESKMRIQKEIVDRRMVAEKDGLQGIAEELHTCLRLQSVD